LPRCCNALEDTVLEARKRLVEKGLPAALERKKRETPHVLRTIGRQAQRLGRGTPHHDRLGA